MLHYRSLNGRTWLGKLLDLVQYRRLLFFWLSGLGLRRWKGAAVWGRVGGCRGQARFVQRHVLLQKLRPIAGENPLAIRELSHTQRTSGQAAHDQQVIPFVLGEPAIVDLHVIDPHFTLAHQVEADAQVGQFRRGTGR